MSFHDDSEQIMDDNSSIATVSFGSTRTMEFCVKGKKLVPEYSLEVSNHDMVIMNPGCQDHLLHRICPDKTSVNSSSNEWRFAISFRRVTPFSDDTIDSEISYDEISTSNKQQLKPPNTKPLQGINLLVGDSFLVGLNEDKLGRSGRKLVKNVSESGATIADVANQIDKFYVSNGHPVSSIFVCVGANDIRYCKEKGIKHLKSSLNDLAKKIKSLFPTAKIWFQPIIPLPEQNRFTINNVLNFNKLLFHICAINGIYYLENCFSTFLTFDGFRNENLFRSWHNIHFNNKGLRTLALIYLNIIHSKKFNPLGY